MEGPKEKVEQIPEIKFDPASIKDAESIVELELAVIAGLEKIGKAYLYSGTTTKEDAIDEINSDVIYLLKIDNTIVGDVQYHLKEGNSAEVSGLIIHPNFQKRGIGKRAMSYILEKLKDKDNINLVTHPENTDAIRLYNSFGFEAEKTEDGNVRIMENYYGDGQPRINMILIRK